MKLAELQLFQEGTSSPSDIKIDYEKLKIDYDNLSKYFSKFKEELVSPKEKLPDVVSWIDKFKNKGKDGLGFNHKKRNKKKKYVEMPSDKFCSFCGKKGHIVTDCSSKNEQKSMNSAYVKKIWKLKENASETKEPKQDWVPPTN